MTARACMVPSTYAVTKVRHTCRARLRVSFTILPQIVRASHHLDRRGHLQAHDNALGKLMKH